MSPLSPSALTLPALSRRVDTLASQLAELEDRPEDTIGTTNTYLTRISEGMNWLGGWDREAAYELENVVRYKGKTYVCITAVTAKPAKIVPPPALREALAEGINLMKIAEYVNNGEEIEDTIEPNDPRLRGRFLGEFSCKLYEFRTPSESKISLKNNNFSNGTEKYIIHYSCYDSEGHERLGNFAEYKELVLKGSEKEPNLFYLAIYGGHETETHASIPLPFTLNLTSSGGLQNEPGNLPPNEDHGHWALLAGA